ncbi:MAG: hypothetical protein D4R81_11895 [Nitrospiraceae bacterium]|nr:MAG: hypothetical protein D4R81_11895 [Nitrospiraceae bacterium]
MARCCRPCRGCRQHSGCRAYPPIRRQPQNGIALSKNAHWLFDQGLWSLTDDCRVIVAANRFHESGNDALLLERMAGCRIFLPSSRDYWPDRIHLAWHRKNWGLGPA